VFCYTAAGPYNGRRNDALDRARADNQVPMDIRISRSFSLVTRRGRLDGVLRAFIALVRSGRFCLTNLALVTSSRDL